jgi:hypothetical protein
MLTSPNPSNRRSLVEDGVNVTEDGVNKYPRFVPIETERH